MLLKIIIPLILLIGLIYFFIPKNQPYKINLPDTWELSPGEGEVRLVAVAPLSSNNDLFNENLNVIATKLSSPMPLDEFSKINLKTLDGLLEDFDLEKQERVLLNGEQAEKLIYTHRIGPVNLKVIQYLIVKGRDAYVLTFTADLIDYNKVSTSFQEIASTFKPLEIN